MKSIEYTTIDIHSDIARYLIRTQRQVQEKPCTQNEYETSSDSMTTKYLVCTDKRLPGRRPGPSYRAAYGTTRGPRC